MDPQSAWMWNDARVLFVEVPIRAELGRRLLPRGLELEEPPRATLFVADYPHTGFGSVYREAAVLLPVQDDRGPALHCPWMVVDDDAALILGRELLGFPKKLARIELAWGPGHAVAIVERRGHELIHIEASLERDEEAPRAGFGHRLVNVIGNPVQGHHLLEIPAAAEQIHGARLGEAKVRVVPAEREPALDLATGSTGPARLVHLDFGQAGAGGTPELRGPVDEAWAARWVAARAL